MPPDPLVDKVRALLGAGDRVQAHQILNEHRDDPRFIDCSRWEQCLRADELSTQAADNPKAAMALANVQRELHRFSESVHTLEQLRVRGDATADTHRRAAVMYRSHRAYAEALNQAESALALSPQQPLLLDLVAELAAQTRTSSASEAIQAAHEANATTWATTVQRLLKIDALDEAEALVDQIAASSGDPLVHSAVARFALWRGDTATARPLADRVAIDCPDQPEGHFLLGVCDVLDGNPESALGHLDTALDRAPGPSPSGWFQPAAAWTFRSEACLALGDSSSALKAADTAMTASRHYNPAAHAVRMLAVTEENKRHSDNLPPRLLEVALHIAALMDDPDAVQNRRVRTFVQQVHTALHNLRGNRSDRLTSVDADGRLHPFEPPPYPRSLARRVQQRVRVLPVEQILTDFAALQAAHPNDPTALTYEGEVRVWIGQYKAAIKCFNRALSIDKNTVWAWIGKGAAQLMKGYPRIALWTFARGIRIVGFEGPTVFVYRGEAHRILGRTARARRDLEQAVRSKPKRISAWINLALVDTKDDTMARQLAPAIRRTNPSLWWDAASVAGVDPLDDQVAAVILQSCLDLMRGNRSSNILTYFTPGGVLRCVRWQASDVPESLRLR